LARSARRRSPPEWPASPIRARAAPNEAARMRGKVVLVAHGAGSRPPRPGHRARRAGVSGPTRSAGRRWAWCRPRGAAARHRAGGGADDDRPSGDADGPPRGRTAGAAARAAPGTRPRPAWRTRPPSPRRNARARAASVCSGGGSS